MRFLLKILLLVLLVGSPMEGICKKKKPYLQTFTDSLVSKLRSQAILIDKNRPDFEANIFLKSDVSFTQKNRLQEYLPYLNKASKRENHYNAEFIGGVTFTNPNMYNQTLFSISSNKKRFIEKHIEPLMEPNLRLNIYSQYLFGNLYSPLAYKSGRYYQYSLDSIWQYRGNTYYKIGFTPNFSSYKLVKGHFIATDRNWSIREMVFSGGMEFMDYTNHVKMGNEGDPDEFLTKKLEIHTKGKVLGNHLKGNYVTTLKYNSIEPSHFVRVRGRGKYNLSQQYKTKTDTISALANFIMNFRDSVVLAVMPPVPRKDTIAPKKKAPKTLEKVGKFVVDNHSFDLRNVGQLKIYPLISPVLLDYSTRHGISYTQKLKYTKVTPKDKLFYLEQRVGYNFKYKEFYWRLKGEMNYAPRHMSRVFLDVGNGNKIETDRILKALDELPFMVFDSTKLNLEKFRNSYARAGHKIEVFNGFTLSTNIALQTYQEMGSSDLTLLYPDSRYAKRAQEIARHTYRSFVPEVEISYTPHQYYYYDGERKVYLYSRYPTFTVNFAKAIEGVFNSTTAYNRLEVDMSHKVNTGPMHTLYYRVGAGMFFDYTDLFFAEFNYFRKNNLPSGWDDDIGGAFQLLRRRQYNEVDKYLRANIRYDAPFLLVPSLFKKVKYITREKLYCNLLFANKMKPYFEMGYGFGTYLFNVGLFWGGQVNKPDVVGVKFTFEVLN